MDYKVVSHRLNIDGGLKKYLEICTSLLKEGWEPYGSPIISSFVYEDGSGPVNISQAFVKQNTLHIKDYVVVNTFNQNDVSLLLYKGWKLYGNIMTTTERFGGCNTYQALIKLEEQPSLLD